MEFKNNRLVEVKDSSIYDDIDRSSGSLYNSFLSYGSSPIGIALFSFRRQIPSADIADLANFLRCHSNLDISQKQQPRLYLEQVVTFRE